MNYDNILRTAISAAYKSGEILKRYLGNVPEIIKKGEIDLVTKADTESEKAVIDTIRSCYPDHTILAEESGLSETEDSAFKWIIDPLDGTTNFAHQLPLFSISIAFSENGIIKAAVVFNPITNELFSAIKDSGANLNGRPIDVSKTENVSDSLLVTGFPYDFKTILDPVMKRFTNCLRAAQGVRRLGSAALDLCYVACGRFDGYWEQNLKPWDTAAGFLIAEEAGAIVTDFSNETFTIDKKQILATNGNIHSEMLSLIKLKD